MAAEHFEGWAIVRLTANRQLAGWVTPVTLSGAELLRVDHPVGNRRAYVTPDQIEWLDPATEDSVRAWLDSTGGRFFSAFLVDRETWAEWLDEMRDREPRAKPKPRPLGVIEAQLREEELLNQAERIVREKDQED